MSLYAAQRVVGHDGNHIWRVHAPTLGEAQIEATLYVQHRPDTGPLDTWTFTLQHLCSDGMIEREERL